MNHQKLAEAKVLKLLREDWLPIVQTADEIFLAK